MRAQIAIAYDAPGILAIRDLNTGAMSVTNDAEAVVAWLHRHGDLGDRRLIYQDTDGCWDEMVHHGGDFISFSVIHAASLEDAMARIRPQTYSVEVCVERGGATLEKIYEGTSYQDAFDYASMARSNRTWRMKWIKFQTPEATKWAEIR